MERMVANRTRNYGNIDPRQVGDNLCIWISLLERIGYVSITIWWLYIWLVYGKLVEVPITIFKKFSLMQVATIVTSFWNEPIVITIEEP